MATNLRLSVSSSLGTSPERVNSTDCKDRCNATASGVSGYLTPLAPGTWRVNENRNLGTLLSAGYDHSFSSITGIPWLSSCGLTVHHIVAREVERMASILIVEDTRTQALMIQHILKNAGHQCTLARSGPEALTLIQTTDLRFDLVLSDINMPEMDGFQLCSQFKQFEQNTPFVLMVSLIDPAEVLKSIECTADNIILKEFESSYFTDQVEAILTLSKLRRLSQVKETVLIPGRNCTRLPDIDNHKLADILISSYCMALHQRSQTKSAPEAIPA